MNALTGIAVFLLVLALGFLWLAFGAYIVTLNVVDMQNNGVTFWPMFWIMLIAALTIGGGSRAAKS